MLTKKMGNDYKLTFVVFIGSLFFVLILGVVALHGIQQLVVNFAFPVVILSSWFRVLINVVIIQLVAIALHGIQQLVVNFAFPVVLLRSWFLVLICVVMIKNIGNINKGSIDIFLFESRFVEKKNSLIGDNKTVYNVIVHFCFIVILGKTYHHDPAHRQLEPHLQQKLHRSTSIDPIEIAPFQNATQVPPASFLLPSLPP